jgi:hypothetical protein
MSRVFLMSCQRRRGTEALSRKAVVSEPNLKNARGSGVIMFYEAKVKNG